MRDNVIAMYRCTLLIISTDWPTIRWSRDHVTSYKCSCRARADWTATLTYLLTTSRVWSSKLAVSKRNFENKNHGASLDLRVTTLTLSLIPTLRVTLTLQTSTLALTVTLTCKSRPVPNHRTTIVGTAASSSRWSQYSICTKDDFTHFRTLKQHANSSV